MARDRREKKKRLILSLLSVALAVGVAVAARGCWKRDYCLLHVDGHAVHVVKIDIREAGVRIRPVVAAGWDFGRIINKWKPRAAINGSYFDADFRPLGDVISGGRVLARGHRHSAIVVTKSGRVEFRRRVGRAPFKCDDCSEVLAAGPMLLRRGRPALDPEAEGFRRASRTIQAPRSGIGLTADGGLLLVVIEESVTLDEMADVMLRLGAADAMNLDGGMSCALYGDKRIVVAPASPMSSAIMIVGKPN